MGNNPEVIRGTIESDAEIQDTAAERTAELAKTLEHQAEQSPDARSGELAHARAEAHKEALMSKERGSSEKKSGGEPTSGQVRKVTKQQKKAEYANTMSAIRSEMSAPARTFSKLIHAPVVEQASAVIGNTVARPNALLAGSTTAFVAVALIYIIAKRYGYPLSGFESIGAFGIGWLLGITFDYIRLLIKGSRT